MIYVSYAIIDFYFVHFYFLLKIAASFEGTPEIRTDQSLTSTIPSFAFCLTILSVPTDLQMREEKQNEKRQLYGIIKIKP